MLKISLKIIAVLILTSSILSCNGEKSEKIGVVDLQVLYNSFEYQQELAIDYNNQELVIQSIIDSLDNNVMAYEQFLANSTNLKDAEKNQLFDKYYYSYVQEKEVKNQELKSFGDELTNLVWNQLNSYLSEFGELNDYDMILGMKGDGSVMYVKETTNITEEVVSFVNLKYNGE